MDKPISESLSTKYEVALRRIAALEHALRCIDKTARFIASKAHDRVVYDGWAMDISKRARRVLEKPAEVAS